MIGKVLTPELIEIATVLTGYRQQITMILSEIEATIWEFDYYVNDRPHYGEGAFSAAVKIFFSVAMEKMFLFQMEKKVTQEESLQMAHEFGNKMHDLIKEFTNIDTHKFYK